MVTLFRPLVRETVANRLRWAYRSHATAPRHGVTISGRPVDVIASEHLAAELRRVVGEVLS
jgi:hypothetical protein